MSKSRNDIKNELIQALPQKSFDAICDRLEPVDFPLKMVLAEPEEQIDHVYFPDAGVVSVVMEAEEGGIVEVATVGREGLVNTPVLLGADSSHARALIQVAGSGHRIKADDFRRLVDRDVDIRRRFLRYTQALIGQISQATGCNRLHNIEERAARWLLMTHDRVDGDTFGLTQEFLAQMLGVRRQAVNVAAGMLQQAGLIVYTRGSITVLDRKGLEGTSCECYEAIQKQFKKLLNE